MDNFEFEFIKGAKANTKIAPHVDHFVQAYAREMAGVREDTHDSIMAVMKAGELERREAKYRRVVAEAQAANSLVLVQSKGKMAAIGRYLPVPKRDKLYELGSVYTYPEFRGQGLSKLVRKEVLKNIRDQEGPDAKVILATKSPQIKAINQGPEAQLISFQEYLDLCGYDYDATNLANDEAEGWVGYLVDLNKVNFDQ